MDEGYDDPGGGRRGGPLAAPGRSVQGVGLAGWIGADAVRGFFEIGIYHHKTSHNIGTLWRTAYQLGASGIFTICRRYKAQTSDTLKTTRHIPYRHWECFELFYMGLPHDAQLIGVETGGEQLASAKHPTRAVYLLGAEDHGLPPTILEHCHKVISIEAVRAESFNVAVAGAIVMYDRLIKGMP